MAKKLKWEPLQWIEQLENIKIMRKDKNAPVDLDGCESISSLNPLITPKVILI